MLNGHKAVVVGAPWATHLIVTARTGGGQRDAQGVSVFLVEKDAKGVTTRDYPTVDGARASEVYFENVSAGRRRADRPGRPRPAAGGEGGGRGDRRDLRRGLRRAAQAARGHAGVHPAAQAVRRSRSARFQVLQHRMVDMFIHVEQAISMTYMATHQGRRATPSAPRPSRRPRCRSARPAASSARTPSSCTAAWA